MNYFDLVNLSHILLISPLLIYVGYYRERADPRAFNLLIVLGIVAILYHAKEYMRLGKM